MTPFVGLIKLQDVVGEWAEETFPVSTMGSCLNHLRREVNEFEDSNEWGAYSPEELADCFLIILHLAHKMDINLETHAAKKFEKNQKRKWGQPGADGVVEHTEEG